MPADVPSPSRVFRALGLSPAFPDNAAVRAAQARGRAVHLAIQYAQEGTLDEGTVPAPALPFYAAWRRFVDECGWTPVAIEQDTYHASLPYHGIIDAIGHVGDEDMPSVVDWKTGDSFDPTYWWQVACYGGAWNSAPARPQIREHRTVCLSKDGTYRIKTMTPQERLDAWQEWVAVLRVYHLKARLGRLD